MCSQLHLCFWYFYIDWGQRGSNGIWQYLSKEKENNLQRGVFKEIYPISMYTYVYFCTEERCNNVRIHHFHFSTFLCAVGRLHIRDGRVWKSNHDRTYPPCVPAWTVSLVKVSDRLCLQPKSLIKPEDDNFVLWCPNMKHYNVLLWAICILKGGYTSLNFFILSFPAHLKNFPQNFSEKLSPKSFLKSFP